MSRLALPVIELLKKRAGYDVTTPYGSSMLQKDIELKTGQRLGLNTVKRLVGLIEYKSESRQDTLDIIASYLEFKSWDNLLSYINDKVSSFDSLDSILDLEILPKGKSLQIEWDPGRKIILQHLGCGEYLTLESINSKLKKGDLVSLSQISIGFPLVVKRVIRNNEYIGNYKAAIDSGITGFKIF